MIVRQAKLPLPALCRPRIRVMVPNIEVGPIPIIVERPHGSRTRPWRPSGRVYHRMVRNWWLGLERELFLVAEIARVARGALGLGRWRRGNLAPDVARIHPGRGSVDACNAARKAVLSGRV
jgi:hypothetical protein